VALVKRNCSPPHNWRYRAWLQDLHPPSCCPFDTSVDACPSTFCCLSVPPPDEFSPEMHVISEKVVAGDSWTKRSGIGSGRRKRDARREAGENGVHAQAASAERATPLDRHTIGCKLQLEMEAHASRDSVDRAGGRGVNPTRTA
jgi:hypothetical protein